MLDLGFCSTRKSIFSLYDFNTNEGDEVLGKIASIISNEDLRGSES